MQLPLSLCSWSLDVTDPARLAELVTTYGIDGVHYHIDHLVNMSADERAGAIEAVRASGLRNTATMIHGFAGEEYSSLQAYRDTAGLIPEGTFAERRLRVLEAARVTRDLGVSILTFHVGFIPDPSQQPAFDRLVVRFGELADRLNELGVMLGFETGQESADTLYAFLMAVDRTNIGVNFDPANMILYAMGDPVASVIKLAPFLKHLHAKDAKRIATDVTNRNILHGEEVVIGDGDAEVMRVIAEAYARGYRGAVAIEREAGATRHQDILTGVARLRALGESLS